MNPAPKPDNLKRCVECKEKKPIRDFDFPRAKTCKACRVRYFPQPLPTPVSRPKPGTLSSDQLAYLNATQHERNKAYMRARHRATVQATSTAIDASKPLKPRTCRACRQVKPALAFTHPRWRLCRECDAVTPSV